MKHLKLYEWKRMSQNGYTLLRRIEDQLREISGITYETGTTNYINNQMNNCQIYYKDILNEELQLREEFRIYRTSLKSPKKSMEIQRLVNSRIPLKNERGVIIRDNNGVILYRDTFQNDSFEMYIEKVKKMELDLILSKNEYQSTVIYTNMIDEAEGRTFLAKAKVQNYDELSELIKR